MYLLFWVHKESVHCTYCKEMFLVFTMEVPNFHLPLCPFHVSSYVYLIIVFPMLFYTCKKSGTYCILISLLSSSSFLLAFACAPVTLSLSTLAVPLWPLFVHTGGAPVTPLCPHWRCPCGPIYSHPTRVSMLGYKWFEREGSALPSPPPSGLVASPFEFWGNHFAQGGPSDIGVWGGGGHMFLSFLYSLFIHMSSLMSSSYPITSMNTVCFRIMCYRQF